MFAVPEIHAETTPSNISDNDELIARLRLLRSENIGPITYHQLIARYGTAHAALDALPSLARRGGRSTLRIASYREAQEELKALKRTGARLIAHGEPEYPDSLATMPDAPPLISSIGNAELLRRPCVAMVGARNASGAGVRFARTLAAELGEAGFTVVSGLARGIDTAAHTGALEFATIAVLAGGIDSIYPPENDILQGRIAAEGLLVAEQKIGTRFKARHFPTRNRLISGSSLGVIIIEAAPRSGSLITARCALEQGREVFAVPGSSLDSRCHGSNNLIREGAALIQSVDDVTAVLAPMIEPRQTPNSPALPVTEMPIIGDEELAKSRHRVTVALGPTPVAVDELLRQCHLTPPVLLTILLELETAGRLHRHPGNRVSFFVINPFTLRRSVNG